MRTLEQFVKPGLKVATFNLSRDIIGVSDQDSYSLTFLGKKDRLEDKFRFSGDVSIVLAYANYPAFVIGFTESQEGDLNITQFERVGRQGKLVEQAINIPEYMADLTLWYFFKEDLNRIVLPDVRDTFFNDYPQGTDQERYERFKQNLGMKDLIGEGRSIVDRAAFFQQ